MRRRRRGLSIGSILALLLTLAAGLGSIAFFSIVGRDSPIAAMSLEDVVGSIGAALQSPQPQLPGTGPTAKPFVVAAAAPASTPSPRPAPVQLHLSLGGMLRFESDIQESESFRTNDPALLGGIAPLFQGELSLAGFDQIIAEPRRRGDDLMVPPAAMDLMKRAGLSGLLMPVQRVMEAGSQPALDTLQQLEQRYLQPLGLGEGGLRRLRVNGLSIIHLHLSERAANPGEALYRGPALEQALGELHALRKDSQLLIVSLGSSSQEREPTAAARSAARRLVQAGADLVIGIGASQVQEIERYPLTDSDGSPREALIVYSLGTLLQEDRRKPEALSGMVLQIALTVEPGQRSLSIRSLSYTPTWQRRWTSGGKVHFAVLNALAAPPEGMSQTHKKAMAEAAQRVQQAIKLSDIKPQR